uniref:Uncharacterized protein n=1 Tax=Solanum lycopersicum TaxID=4081 RepID=K4D7T4_SOLLC
MEVKFLSPPLTVHVLGLKVGFTM